MPRRRRISKARVVTAEGGDGAAQVKAVCIKKGITLVSMDSPGMWHQVGFLADAFQMFKAHGMSVDLVSTSETNVTVSLDPAANTLDSALLDALVDGSGAAVPRAGDRAVRLGEPGGAQHPRHPAPARRCVRAVRGAEDLSGQPGGERSELHVRGGREPGRPAGRAAARTADPPGAGRSACSARLGSSCSRSRAAQARARAALVAPRSATELHARCWTSSDSAYVYDLATRARRRARRCARIKSVARVHYAMKANPHREIAASVCTRRAGLRVRVARAKSSACSQTCPDIDRQQILFTPNFAPRAEYAWAFEQRRARHRRQLLRRSRRGRKCSAAAKSSCASTPASGAATTTTCARPARTRSSACRSPSSTGLASRAQELGARIVGLHAHNGSGVFDRRELGAVPRTLLDRARATISRRASHRCRRRPRRAGARGSAGRRLREARRRAAAADARRTRSWSCGSSRAATWWPLPACCSRGSRSSRRKSDVRYVGRGHRA